MCKKKLDPPPPVEVVKCQATLPKSFPFTRTLGEGEVIGVYAISDKGKLEIQELNLTTRNIVGKLRSHRLRELSLRGEGIYFAPKTDACNLLMLSDPTGLEGLPCGTMVVQTSAKKHQLHLPYLGQPASLSIRTRFQRYLRSVYDSDKGAVSANHPRRLPGFLNQKYPDKPIRESFTSSRMETSSPMRSYWKRSGNRKARTPGHKLGKNITLSRRLYLTS